VEGCEEVVDREELAWAAGLFDGEGCIFTANSQSRYGYPRMSMGQNDPEVLQRFASAVEAGTVLIRGTLTSAGKEHWVYRCTQWRDVQAIVAKLWPWLGSVKRAQAKVVFLKFKDELKR
jgi:hypothetical protein